MQIWSKFSVLVYISKDYARAIANMHAVRLLLLATYLHVQIISLGLIRNLKLKASLFFCNADMFAQLVLIVLYLSAKLTKYTKDIQKYHMKH